MPETDAVLEKRDAYAQTIGDAIEKAIGRGYLDDYTAYGVALMVLEYIQTGKVTPDEHV